MTGTINISRDLWDDTAFAAEKFSEREAWIWLISEASWKPRTRRIGKLVVETKRGQVAGSVRFFANAFGWSKSRFARFLGRLSERDMVSVESGTGINVITIRNYNKYQSQSKSDGTAAGQQRDSSGTKEKKGERRGKEGGKKEQSLLRSLRHLAMTSPSRLNPCQLQTQRQRPSAWMSFRHSMPTTSQQIASAGQRSPSERPEGAKPYCPGSGRWEASKVSQTRLPKPRHRTSSAAGVNEAGPHLASMPS